MFAVLICIDSLFEFVVDFYLIFILSGIATLFVTITTTDKVRTVTFTLASWKLVLAFKVFSAKDISKIH